MTWRAARAAAGWILAAFFCGILVGRVRDGPKEKKPESGVARGTDEPDREAMEKAKKAKKEWENFLNYDGTAQEPIK